MKHPLAPVRIRFARPPDFPTLQRIERAAADMFVAYGVAESVLQDSTSIADFREAEENGLLWVAVDEDDSPIGFAFVEHVGEYAHLDELDVDPRHGRRGVGSALVRTVCAWAKEHGFPGVTLTTFRDIPWNAPFYRRLGFDELNPNELTPVLHALVRKEAKRGLQPSRRVVMRWRPG
jgi:GNAT superfamily N-acetyltransferase